MRFIAKFDNGQEMSIEIDGHDEIDQTVWSRAQKEAEERGQKLEGVLTEKLYENIRSERS